MDTRKKYRCVLCLLLFFGLTGLGAAGYAAICGGIPDQLTTEAGGEVPELFSCPLNLVVDGKIISECERKNRITYSLFGKIPLKTVTACVAEPISLYAGGKPIGIYMQTDGVMVVDTGNIRTAEGTECCPAKNIVQTGDYIRSINGEALKTKEELVECVNRSNGAKLVMEVERDGQEMELTVAPVADETGTYRAGIWVRSDTQGIGTLTYLDDEGHFGALGHGISDVDTGRLMKIEKGILYDAEVLSVVKGQQGRPGELAGVIHYNEGYQTGIIEENRENGIYGTVCGFPKLSEGLRRCPVAYRQSVQKGAASILCTIDGVCQEYAIEIDEIRLNGSDMNKAMVITVTDPKLLERTGGIVQGMSGSPVLQNGRIVGAVTHVFVNDPTRGYGIFIEDMLERQTRSETGRRTAGESCVCKNG